MSNNAMNTLQNVQSMTISMRRYIKFSNKEELSPKTLRRVAQKLKDLADKATELQKETDAPGLNTFIVNAQLNADLIASKAKRVENHNGPVDIQAIVKKMNRNYRTQQEQKQNYAFVSVTPNLSD